MLDIHQYDTPEGYCIRLEGALEGESVEQLEHAWLSAASTLRGRQLALDIAGLTRADGEGLDLLTLLRDSGTQLTASRAPQAPELAARLGVEPPPEPAGPCGFRTAPRSLLRTLWLAISPR